MQSQDYWAKKALFFKKKKKYMKKKKKTHKISPTPKIAEAVINF
jgi:hypothetical protein